MELCAPFDMEVVVFDPYVDEATAQDRGVQLVTLAELIERSDFVQVTCPLTAETQGLIGKAQFAAMKPTAFFITTARGPVHDEAALYDALVSGGSRERVSTCSTKSRRSTTTRCCTSTTSSRLRTPRVSRSRPLATSPSPPRLSGRRFSTAACRHVY